jgi:hypothetical protein
MLTLGFESLIAAGALLGSAAATLPITGPILLTSLTASQMAGNIIGGPFWSGLNGGILADIFNVAEGAFFGATGMLAGSAIGGLASIPSSIMGLLGSPSALAGVPAGFGAGLPLGAIAAVGGTPVSFGVNGIGGTAISAIGSQIFNVLNNGLTGLI